MKKQTWYTSRRVWASLLTLAVTIALVVNPTGTWIEPVATLLASALGLLSWKYPK